MAYGLTDSASLNGSKEFTRAVTASLTFTNTLTVELWVKFNSVPSSGGNVSLVANYGSGADTNHAWLFYLQNSGGTLRLVMNINQYGGSGQEVHANWTPSTGVWYHVAATVNSSGGAEFFIDGTSIGTATFASYTGWNSPPVPYEIGGGISGTSGWFVNGHISLVRIWNAIRTATQLSDNKCTVLGSTTGLAAEWTLDNTLNDNSGNSNTLSNPSSISFTADVPSVCSVSAYTKTLTETLTTSDSLLKTTARALTETLTTSASIITGVARSLSEGVSTAATLVKNPGKVLIETGSGTPSVVDSYSESNYSGGGYSVYSGLPEYAQSFTGNGNTLDSAKFYLKKVGSPTGNVYAKIYAHTGTFGSGGTPTGSALAVSDAVDVSTIGTSNALQTFSFSGANRITLANGTHYCVVISYSGGTAGVDFIIAGYDSTSPTHAGNAAYYDTSWHATSPDICFYVYGVGSTGAFSLSDSFASSITSGHIFAETLTLADTLIRKAVRTLSETLTLAASAIAHPVLALSESATLTDALTALNGHTTTLSETITSTASLIRTTARSFAESVTSSDTFIGFKAIPATLTEAITVADTLTRTAKKTLSETASIAAALIRSIAHSFSEAVSLSDTIITVSGLARTLSESITTSDTLARATARTISEAITTSASLIRVTSRAFIETITMSDALIRSVGRIFSETVSLADTLVKLPSRVLSEALAASDSLIKATTRAFSETLSLSDTLRSGIKYGRVLTEAITASASLARSIVHVLAENITLTDVVRKLLNGLSALWTNTTRAASTFTNRTRSPADWTDQTRSAASWDNRRRGD